MRVERLGEAKTLKISTVQPSDCFDRVQRAAAAALKGADDGAGREELADAGAGSYQEGARGYATGKGTLTPHNFT